MTRDISERKKAEKELREKENKLVRLKKMESLGLMAGGIAHDLNNLLSGIVSYPDIILADLPEDSPLKENIEEIKESGIRASTVVSDLLTVARGIATTRETTSLNTAISEYINSPEHIKFIESRPNIDFKVDLQDNLLNIVVSPTHLKKVLMNLTINAADAIEDQGTVTISSSNCYLDKPLTGYEDVRPGEYVLLKVSDNGIGISPDHLQKIFEPFYTKKIMGRGGTGLGLAIVWNMLKDHDGYINVKSGDNGTEFELFFPASRKEISEARQKTNVEAFYGNGEKILIVDDEDNQRNLASKLLKKLGYNTQTVSSGEEAVTYLKDNTADLILLDMIMPNGLNGRETYEQIVTFHPHQKAIIASGFAETKDVKEAQKYGSCPYVKKPYTLEEIGMAIKEELGK
jgi:nitrogen-specific signal transduction histidine kinase